MTVIIDTNVFILTVTTDFPLFTEIKERLGPRTVATTQSVIDELSGLAEDGNAAADAAQDLIQSKGLKIVSGSSSHADQDILDYAAEHVSTVVITQDTGLIDELHEEDITVYRPRQQRYLTQANA